MLVHKCTHHTAATVLPACSTVSADKNKSSSHSSPALRFLWSFVDIVILQLWVESILTDQANSPHYCQIQRKSFLRSLYKKQKYVYLVRGLICCKPKAICKKQTCRTKSSGQTRPHVTFGRFHTSKASVWKHQPTKEAWRWQQHDEGRLFFQHLLRGKKKTRKNTKQTLKHKGSLLLIKITLNIQLLLQINAPVE